MDIIFGIPAEEVADMRARGAEFGNTGLELLLYWSMRKAWKNGKEGVEYPDDTILHEDWPGREGRIILACETLVDGRPRPDSYVVDISPRNSLYSFLGNVIHRFLDRGYDGMHFDSAAWDIYYKGRGNRIGVLDEEGGCRYPGADTGFVMEFVPRSRDFAVSYHSYMQREVIDPSSSNAKIHIANGIPRNRVEWDRGGGDKYVQLYFMAGVDGMQMDGAIMEKEHPHRPEDIDFQLGRVRLFTEDGRYFLFKSWVPSEAALSWLSQPTCW